MTERTQTLEEAFPEIDAGLSPLGSRVLVQIKTPDSFTKSGIWLGKGEQDAERWNTQVAKVIDMGKLAFRNRNTMELWIEGQWCEKGDFVRVPKYGGDRYYMPNPKNKDVPAMFVIFNDHDIVGKIVGDPLAVKAFI